MRKLTPLVVQMGVVFLAAVAPVLAGQNVVATPEPATVLLIGGGIGGLVLFARRQRSKK
jgi:PEP-CTERM motif